MLSYCWCYVFCIDYASGISRNANASACVCVCERMYLKRQRGVSKRLAQPYTDLSTCECLHMLYVLYMVNMFKQTPTEIERKKKLCKVYSCLSIEHLTDSIPHIWAFPKQLEASKPWRHTVHMQRWESDLLEKPEKQYKGEKHNRQSESYNYTIRSYELISVNASASCGVLAHLRSAVTVHSSIIPH